MQMNDGWTEMSRFDGVGVPLSIGWVPGAPVTLVATLGDRLRRAWRLLCVTSWSRPPACGRYPAHRAGGRMLYCLPRRGD